MRSILLAPAPVARAAALGATTREQRWMLAQPDAVRHSYVKAVLAHDPAAPPEQAWMLKQPRKVRESYVREVLERS